MRLIRSQGKKHARKGWAAATVILVLTFGCGPRASEIGLGPPSTNSQAHRVTFVQWSDPHLFDAGGNRHGEGIVEEQLDNWAALHWAVLETNRLVLEEHRPIDFV